MKKSIDNLIMELCAEVDERAPLSPKLSEHYPDITTSIAVGDDYKLLVEMGEKLLEEKHGSKSNDILNNIKKNCRAKLFGD